LVAITVTRNAQITIPKEIRKALGIDEGDRVRIRMEGGRIVVEKVEDEVWSDCTDFLPEDFEKVLANLRTDSRNRFKRLGLIP
jgi:antitoxin PrlF